MFKRQCLLYGPMDLLSFGCSVQWFTLRLFTEFNSVTLLIITRARKPSFKRHTHPYVCMYICTRMHAYILNTNACLNAICL